MAVVHVTGDTFEQEVLKQKERYWLISGRLVRTMSDAWTGY